MRREVFISLENGSVLKGYRFGAQHEVCGELAFTTSMVGYTEALTDPVNSGKVLVQTFPLIGNYGIMKADMESDRAWVRAYVVREVCQHPSNFRMDQSLESFLEEQGVVGVYGIDTRQLTKILREEGVVYCVIADEPKSKEEVLAKKSLQAQVVMQSAARKEEARFTANNPTHTLAFWDLGDKRSRIQMLLQEGYDVIALPMDVTAEYLLSLGVDGVVVSDGPGAPENYASVICHLRKVLGKIPVLGLGMGHLLVAHALGGESKKQKYGHRGANQPVKCLKNTRVYVTSQNHEYEVVTETIKDCEVCFINVNDGSCEGIEYASLKAITVQFDPISCAIGHTDNVVLDRFSQMMRKENYNG